MLGEKEVNGILDRLIALLCAERNIQPPRLRAQNKHDCFRALCNVRPPQPASEEFIKLQDTYLRDYAERRGIVDVGGPEFRGAVTVWQGDITRLNADAIVNACNPTLLGCFQPLHDCIDNAIHTAAGVQLRLACDRIMRGGREPNGCVEVTDGYNLPAKYVFHTVGPVAYGGHVNDRCRTELESCYRSCMEEAVKRELSSIAFCCISTGAYGFDAAEACRIATDTVEKTLKETGARLKVIFDVWLDRDRLLYEERLRASGV